MLFFKKHKKLSHKQTSMIGFVLAVISTLASVILVYGTPLLSALLNRAGLNELDLYLLATAFVFLLSIQGLLLFGFPLYYAKDKKSHMTGFQILLYALFWMLVIAAVIIGASLLLNQGAGPVSVTDFVQ